jgi:hypothetical protein
MMMMMNLSMHMQSHYDLPPFTSTAGKPIAANMPSGNYLAANLGRIIHYFDSLFNHTSKTIVVSGSADSTSSFLPRMS